MADSKRITRNLSFIKKTIVDVDGVMDILIEEEILGMNERNIILSENDLIHSVLDIVIKKQAYHKLVKALQSTGNERIVTRLEATECKIGLEKERTETETPLSEQDVIRPEEVCKNQKTSILQGQLEILKMENDNLKEQQAQIRKNLNEKQKTLLDLKRESCNYQKQNLELNQRLSILRKRDNAQSTIDDLENQLKEKDIRNKEIRKELQHKTDEVETLQKLIKNLRIEVDEKSDQIATLSREMKLLEKEHLTARSERRELKLKVEKINNNFDEKIQNMMTVLANGSGNTFRTTRQSTFVRQTPRTGTQIKGRGQGKISSTLPAVGPKASKTNEASNPKDGPCRTPRPRSQLLRPQHHMSGFSTKTATEQPCAAMIPMTQWK